MLRTSFRARNFCAAPGECIEAPAGLRPSPLPPSHRHDPASGASRHYDGSPGLSELAAGEVPSWLNVDEYYVKEQLIGTYEDTGANCDEDPDHHEPGRRARGGTPGGRSRQR